MYPDQLLTEERYVAWFDILGMTLVMLNQPNWVIHLLRSFQGARRFAGDRCLVVSPSNRVLRERLYSRAFSDSLFLFSVAATQDDLYSILLRSALLFDAAVVHRVPVRGAITVGDLIHDPESNLVAGPPLVNAYVLAESSDWLGVELDPSVATRASELELTTKLGSPLLVKWDVPTTQGDYRATTVINWPAIFHSWASRERRSAPGFYRGLFAPFGPPFSTLATAVRRKYMNTFSFARFALGLGKKPIPRERLFRDA